MRAVDTSVVVRLLMEDQPEQFASALSLFRTQSTWIPTTVILETEWVLRGGYQLTQPRIAAALRSLIALSGVRNENAVAVSRALDWFERGMDFADALHLASAEGCDGLATFDRDFIRSAARLDAGTVAEP